VGEVTPANLVPIGQVVAHAQKAPE
jgi:hypothetical protein